MKSIIGFDFWKLIFIFAPQNIWNQWKNSGTYWFSPSLSTLWLYRVSLHCWILSYRKAIWLFQKKKIILQVHLWFSRKPFRKLWMSTILSNFLKPLTKKRRFSLQMIPFILRLIFPFFRRLLKHNFLKFCNDNLFWFYDNQIVIHVFLKINFKKSNIFFRKII